MEGKVIIISAPSGCGKSTIINAIMSKGNIDMRFSVSATNRAPRTGEVDGVNYYFLTDKEFQDRIDANAFVEYEEVYKGRYYGTLRSEVDRILESGHNVVLDIDVKGGLNVKRQFGDRALSIFIKPPSIDALRCRLEKRATDTPEVIAERISKADYELSFIDQYDSAIVNDDLETAIAEVEGAINDFLLRP
ncbi:MAG: guanylate kinase [Muribaculaceae bacterium]|nr:guanylate kinase [Muribaculaceae bacterium]